MFAVLPHERHECCAIIKLVLERVRPILREMTFVGVDGRASGRNDASPHANRRTSTAKLALIRRGHPC